MKTISERLVTFKAEKDGKIARMNELMAGEGQTLEAPQQEEFDTLREEVKSIDEHLSRLELLEQANKAAAVRPNGESPEGASASRGTQPVITVKQQLPPGIEFARYAMCLASARGNRFEALQLAKERYPDNPAIHVMLKAAVAGGTTTDATWAGPLVDHQNFLGDFIEFLRPMTIIGRIPNLRRVPFNIRITGQTSGGDAYWVGQGAPKPLTKFDFTAITMNWAKVAAISVLTEELVRFSSPSAEALVRDSLAAAVVARMDQDFIDPNKAEVANVSPASITWGVTPIASSGGSANDVRVDIQNLFAPYIAANQDPTNAVWIMSTTTALALSLLQNALGQREFPSITMTGGTFLGLPVVTSQYVVEVGSPESNIVIIANASDIYLADDGQVTIDASREASLQMDDAPTNNSATPTATSLVSMFQTDSIALRVHRFVNWKKRRAEAVQFMRNVTWGATGGSPS